MEYKGKAWKFGSNIDTDIIIPGVYLHSIDSTTLGKHCMEGLVPDFSEKISIGDIVVAGENFGCGSSREHAPIALRGAGLSCVIAKSFSRLFFRNSINIGFPIFESIEGSEKIKEGDSLEIKPGRGTIVNMTQKETYKFKAYAEFVTFIFSSGGLLNLIKQRGEEL